MNEPGKSAGDVISGDATLPDLVTRLGEDILTLVDSRLSLLRIEMQEEILAYGRNLVALSVAGTVVAVGVVLMNVALALVVADLLRSTGLGQAMQYAVGFAATGLVCLGAGATTALRSWNRLAKRAAGHVEAITNA